MINELNGKKLLVLGGNLYADSIFEFCSDNGIEVYSVSNDPLAAIHKNATKAFVHDSTDLNFIKSIISSERIDGVYLGGNEQVITKVCGLVNDLGFPCYCNPVQWAKFQNKGLFKEMCKGVGLPVVKRYPYSPEKPCDVHFPVITKPADASGSSGFSICENYEELKAGFAFAKNNSFGGDVIVEDYVDNKGHVVFYSFSNGNPVFCQLHDKYPVRIKKNGSFIAGAHVAPSRFSKEFYSLFHKKLCSLFSTIGVQEGTVWIEVFHDRDRYYFNEAGFRYGGSSSIFPVDYFTGINQIAADIYFALTGKSILSGFKSLISDGTEKGKQNYCMLPIHSKPGVIGSVSINAALSSMPQIVKVIQKKTQGMTVPDTGDFSQNIGYIHFVFDDKKEFIDLIRTIRDSYRVFDENGQYMLIFQPDDFFENIII